MILTGSVQASVETAINPDRLVLILPGTVSDAKQKRFPLDANGVHGVRLGLNSASPPVTRVVVDLDSAHPYTLNTEGNRITLRVQPSANAEVVVRHIPPAPAASAPLIGVFHRKPQTPASEPITAQAPIPVPPKFPPINFPEKQPASNPQPAASTASAAAPSAAHPKLGSLQQGTVFPGMGTPGAGTVPVAQNAPPIPSNSVTVETAQSADRTAAEKNTLVVKTAPDSNVTSGANPASSMTVNVTPYHRESCCGARAHWQQ